MNSFNQRKKDILGKEDKSSIGGWDWKIVELCDLINSFEEHYTTSSCSGRVIVMKDEEKKGPGLFYFVSHEKVEFGKFFEEVGKIDSGNYKFKQEPVIFHVACRNLDSAKILLEKGQICGFKRSGIISFGKNIIVEINATERFEFPLVENGKLIVSEEFLARVIEKSNFNLEKGWKKIEGFKESLLKLEF